MKDYKEYIVKEIDEGIIEESELIRCKDCKYWNNGHCDGIPFVGDNASYIETEEEDFCSYAERKEE